MSPLPTNKILKPCKKTGNRKVMKRTSGDILIIGREGSFPQ